MHIIVLLLINSDLSQQFGATNKNPEPPIKCKVNTTSSMIRKNMLQYPNQFIKTDVMSSALWKKLK